MSHMQPRRSTNHNFIAGNDLRGQHHPTSLNVNPVTGTSGISQSGHVVYPFAWPYAYGVPTLPPQCVPPPSSPINSSSPYAPAPGVLRHRYGIGRGAPQPPHHPPFHSHPYHMPSPSTALPTDNRSASVHGSSNGLSPSPVENAAPTPPTNDLPLKDQCDALFRHPLFPLLRLLLEKLEEATVTAITPPQDTINAELENIVRRIPSATTTNPDIDDLMIQGVAILRLHLFELEKVNELCRDFCNRYAECLRRNLHTDHILRNDGMDSEASDSSMPMSPNEMQPHPHHSSMQPNPALYQMMNASQNHVAQPMPMHMPLNHPEPPPHRMDAMSMNEMMVSPMSAHSHYDEDKFDPDMDDDSSPKANRANRRGILPKEAINVMKSWLFQHIVHPYPTEDEKRLLATQTRLSMLQVNNWFINARRRILQPMLDATNPGGHRPKKGMQSRPVDPFWSESAVTTPSSSLPSQSLPAVSVHNERYFATKSENGLPSEAGPANDDDSNTPNSDRTVGV